MNKTARQKKDLLEALHKSLGVVTTACERTGIGRTTYYDWYRNDPEFKTQVDSLEDVALDFTESKLHERIREGDTTAIIFHLKTRGKKRGYVERQEIATDPTSKINIEIVGGADKDN